MKRNIRICIAALSAVICMVMYAGNTIQIKFKDGSSRQINVGILSFSKVDTDGIVHDNFVSQLIVDGNDTTIIPLNSIDAICPEPTLVNVEYITGGEWIDPHDNLGLNYYPYVIRRRIYSDGTVQEDEFYDYGHPARPYPGADYTPCKDEFAGGRWAEYQPYKDENTGDSVVIRTSATQVSELVSVSSGEKIVDGYTTDVRLKDWDNYRLSKRYDESLSVCKDTPCAQDYPAASRPSGWYYQQFRYTCEYNNLWVSSDNFEIPMGCGLIVFDFYDQFLVIDGRRIDFAEHHNLKMNYSFSESSFSNSQKDGKISKLEFNASYLGKNFYSAHIDSIYVAK
ncbi:MAG: hypothetical protein NC043_01980 [Muribaculaceae bacterium]|nr:hypothetical protein [Muribaculaceae bacterium]